MVTAGRIGVGQIQWVVYALGGTPGMQIDASRDFAQQRRPPSRVIAADAGLLPGR
jgi:hypothetical protein